MRAQKTSQRIFTWGLLAIFALSLSVLCGCSMQTTKEADSSSSETTEATNQETFDPTQESDSTGAQSSQDSKAGSSKADTSTASSDASQITVKCTVDSSRAKDFGYPSTMFSGSLSLKSGSSVYDALKATGLSIQGTKSYISGISGLAERGCNQPSSGWMYAVNGVYSNKDVGKYILSDGDELVFKFIFSYTEVQ